MEYCNLGPLHHYMAERRFVRQMAVAPAPSGPFPEAASPAPSLPRPAGSNGSSAHTPFAAPATAGVWGVGTSCGC